MMRKLLYFSGSTCPPCKYFWRSIIKPQVADLYPEQVDHVVDRYDVAKRFNIRQTPTLILLEDDEEVQRFVGCSESYVEEILDFLEGKK